MLVWQRRSPSGAGMPPRCSATVRSMQSVAWPGNFDDPASIVARMARAVLPVGVVALFYSNYYQSLFLPGRSRLQHRYKCSPLGSRTMSTSSASARICSVR